MKVANASFKTLWSNTHLMVPSQLDPTTAWHHVMLMTTPQHPGRWHNIRCSYEVFYIFDLAPCFGHFGSLSQLTIHYILIVQPTLHDGHWHCYKGASQACWCCWVSISASPWGWNSLSAWCTWWAILFNWESLFENLALTISLQVTITLRRWTICQNVVFTG